MSLSKRRHKTKTLDAGKKLELKRLEQKTCVIILNKLKSNQNRAPTQN